MTLSPVFRSERAVRVLDEHGVWKRLGPDVRGQAEAVSRVRGDLAHLLDTRFLAPGPVVPEGGWTDSPEALRFLQEFFFLILFRSVFRELGVGRERLELYSELNFCIKGTITAADNLFDDQAKSLLPLAEGTGPRFLSILQLMCFERLLRRALDRAVEGGGIGAGERDRILRGLLDRMAEIGLLEGSEEGGVEEIPTPDVMVERVHRVRGGALFALAFVAPRVAEEGASRERILEAEPAIARLGTAFQIVDDLTDFEFDVGRRSHNLLVAQVRHHGTDEERAALDACLETGEGGVPRVEDAFRTSAGAVLERARTEARAALDALAELGHWFPPELAPELVRAIVGLDGVARMEALAER